MATGISCVHPDKPRQLFVNEVGVAGPYRRAGVGRRLVEALLAHGERLGCVEAWVATETSNAPARALYRATGGQEDASSRWCTSTRSPRPGRPVCTDGGSATPLVRLPVQRVRDAGSACHGPVLCRSRYRRAWLGVAP